MNNVIKSAALKVNETAITSHAHYFQNVILITCSQKIQVIFTVELSQLCINTPKLLQGQLPMFDQGISFCISCIFVEL